MRVKSDSKRSVEPRSEKLKVSTTPSTSANLCRPRRLRRAWKSWSIATIPITRDNNSPLIRGAGGCLSGALALFMILFIGSLANPVHAQNSSTTQNTPVNLNLDTSGQALLGETLYPELEQYIQMAIEQNPELQSLRTMVEADQERVREAGVLMDPEINLAYDFNPMMSDSYLGRFSISAMQMFPWFGSLDARRELQESSADASRSRVTTRQLEILRDLQILWLDIAEIREQIRITDETVELIQNLERLVEIRYETGRAGQADILRIQMEEQRLLNRIANLEDRLNPTKARFNELLNREASADVNTADELISRPTTYSEEELQSFILEQHPQFDLISAERSAAGQQLRLAEMDGKPSFGIGVEVMGRDFGPMSMFPDNKEKIIGMAVIRVPLFRTRYDSQKRQANFRLESLDHQQDFVENRLMTELEETLEEIRSAERSFILLDEELVPRARRALTIMSEEYSTGAVRFDELLQLQRELLDLEFERIEAVVKQNKAMATIDSLISGN